MNAPQSIEQLLAAGRAAAGAGEVEQACKLFLKAADAAPPDPATLTRIGAELEKIGRLGRAQSLYLKALKIKPDFAPAHLHAARFYLAAEQPQHALVHLGHAEGELADDPAFRFALGRARLGVRETGAAVEEFRRARAAGLRSLPLYQHLAHALETLNRTEELGEAVKEGLEAYPGDATLTIYLAKFEKRSGEAERAFERLTALNVKGRERDLQATYYFELAGHHDRRGEAEQAFRWYAKANDLKRFYFDQGGFSPDPVLKVIEAQKQTAWKAFAKAASKGKGAQAKPIFLVGFPRSGTTLLDQMLDAHPGLRVLEEKPFLARRITALEEAFGPYPASLSKLGPDDFEKLRTGYLEDVEGALELGSGQSAVDKLPLNLIYLPFIRCLFPRARIILALRHPCDAVLSCFMQNFAENDEMSNFLDLDRGSRFYQALFGLFAAACKDWETACHRVRYEDVIEDLEGEARALISFLGLPWAPAVLDYRKHALERGFINTPSYHQVVQPIYKSAAGRWQAYRTFFEPYLERFAPSCKMFGYDL